MYICSGLRKQKVASAGIIPREDPPAYWGPRLMSAPAPPRPPAHCPGPRPRCPRRWWPPPPPASPGTRTRGPRSRGRVQARASEAGLGSTRPSCRCRLCTCSSGTCCTTPATTPAWSPGWIIQEDASRWDTTRGQKYERYTKHTLWSEESKSIHTSLQTFFESKEYV